MYAWERRVPLVPADVAALRADGVDLVVQRSAKRAFTDEEYRDVGVPVVDVLDDRSRIIGLKEIPVEKIAYDTLYVFFSHTIKGQRHNMPMLARLMKRRCTLIDYERVVDGRGKRLIFFGNYAGLAGMIDALWALGQRLAVEGIESPFSELRQASQYADLEAAKAAVRRVGEAIARDGLPEALTPLTVGVAGYGNVSRGAQQILDLLPICELDPEELERGEALARAGRHAVAKVVFHEEHTVEPSEPGASFALQEFLDHPDRYRARFERYLPHLDVLMNCIYWTPEAPRLVTKAWVRDAGPDRRLRVIGDISCDVEGAIEITVHATEPDRPVYVYDADGDRALPGVAGDGPVVLAVEILPSELPREASAYFSGILKQYVPAVAAADLEAPLEQCGLPPELIRATIVYRGELTAPYRDLERHLREQ
ncbi:MAG: hypothetical protein JSW65_04245 [Candidatus Bipolaricaulota bacterium]|nr:MAG: hypothetical protein JSW65_04245 [Candidatus Bipolaricaulota bacterium]